MLSRLLTLGMCLHSRGCLTADYSAGPSLTATAGEGGAVLRWMTGLTYTSTLSTGWGFDGVTTWVGVGLAARVAQLGGGGGSGKAGIWRGMGVVGMVVVALLRKSHCKNKKNFLVRLFWCIIYQIKVIND